VTTYRVELSRRAAKDLKALDGAAQTRVTAVIQALAHDPRPAGAKRLKGYEGEALRVRAGDYRVIYKVDDAVRIVAVVRIGHRREIYR
jgi:mRNA interferase RelE/StbE